MSDPELLVLNPIVVDPCSPSNFKEVSFKVLTNFVVNIFVSITIVWFGLISFITFLPISLIKLFAFSYNSCFELFTKMKVLLAFDTI